MKKFLLLTLVLIASINCFGQTGEFQRDKNGSFTFEYSLLYGFVQQSMEREVIMSLSLGLKSYSPPSLLLSVVRFNNSKQSGYFQVDDGQVIEILDIVGFTIVTPNGSIKCEDFNNMLKGFDTCDGRGKTYNFLTARLSQNDLSILKNLPRSGFKLELLVNQENNIQSIEIKPYNPEKVSAILSNSARQLEILKDLNL